MLRVYKNACCYFLLILSLLCYGTTSFAVRVFGLYQTQVPVSSQSPVIRNQAIQQALAQVFIKLSGSSTVINSPKIVTALTQAENLLLSYSYQDGALPNGDDSLFLTTNFDPKATRQILQEAGQNVWGQNRPLVLLWVAYSINQQVPQMISSTTQNIYAAELRRDAKLRGLPILFPILDLTDLQTISPTDISNDNVNAIQNASNRYGSDAILILNLKQTNEQNWTAVWTLLNQGNTSTWQSNATTVAQLLKSGIDATADNLALKYGTLNTDATQSDVQLTVININNLFDYAAVTDYLKDLLPVKRVELQQINSSSLVYNLEVAGGELGLQKALSLDHRLRPVTVIPDLQNSNTGLIYQWGP